MKYAADAARRWPHLRLTYPAVLQAAVRSTVLRTTYPRYSMSYLRKYEGTEVQHLRSVQGYKVERQN